MSLMVWLAVCFSTGSRTFTRALTAPDGGHACRGHLLLLLPGLFPIQHQLPNADSPVFRAHFVVDVGLQPVHAGRTHALLMSVAEKQLHSARSAAWPTAAACSRWKPCCCSGSSAFTFVLLTLTLFSGIMFSEDLLVAFILDHKTVFAIISWFFARPGRAADLGWRGKLAQRWTRGFLALLLATWAAASSWTCCCTASAG